MLNTNRVIRNYLPVITGAVQDVYWDTSSLLPNLLTDAEILLKHSKGVLYDSSRYGNIEPTELFKRLKTYVLRPKLSNLPELS